MLRCPIRGLRSREQVVCNILYFWHIARHRGIVLATAIVMACVDYHGQDYYHGHDYMAKRHKAEQEYESQFVDLLQGSGWEFDGSRAILVKQTSRSKTAIFNTSSN